MELSQAHKHKVGDKVHWQEIENCQLLDREGKVISIIGDVATVDQLRPDGTRRGLPSRKHLSLLLGMDEPAQEDKTE